MAVRDMSWRGLLKRNAINALFASFAFVFFWNGVVIWEWLYALFGGELRGYGLVQQRWHRVWAVGFVVMFAFVAFFDFISVWYWVKYPEKRRHPEEKGK